LAKGQKRNGREPKKPKAAKKKPVAATTIAAAVPSRQKGRFGA
jgi:hypothetical protein